MRRYGYLPMWCTDLPNVDTLLVVFGKQPHRPETRDEIGVNLGVKYQTMPFNQRWDFQTLSEAAKVVWRRHPGPGQFEVISGGDVGHSSDEMLKLAQSCGITLAFHRIPFLEIRQVVAVKIFA